MKNWWQQNKDEIMKDIWLAIVVLAIALMVLSMGCKTTVPVDTSAKPVLNAPVGGDVVVNDDDVTTVKNKQVSNSTWLILGQEIIVRCFWMIIALVVIYGFWKGKWDKFGA